MKNSRFLTLIALLLMAVVTMQAQQFEPLVAEGKQWNVVLTYVPWPPINRVTDVYKMEGDTVLYGTTYKMLFTTQSEHFDDWELCGLFRETEEGQVFFRKYRTNHTFERETLLYDFSLQPGDSICYNDTDYLKLLSISDTILDDGSVRKRYDFHMEGYNFDDHEIWIEGIGSEFGILRAGSRFLVGGIYDLLCYYEDDDLVWQNPSFNSCYICAHSVGTQFFDEASNLLYTITSTNPNCVSVDGHVDGENAQGELNIPETVEYDGYIYTVTTISYRAFYSCEGLTGELVIPNTVTTIQSGAFAYCTGFTGTLVIPNSVIELGTDQTQFTYGGAFAECTGFTHLVLGESLQKIGYSSFYGCRGFIGQLILPEGLLEIWEDAFKGCRGFTGELTIPTSLIKIEYNAFYGCAGFTGSLIIPENVEQIGDNVFAYCVGITSVEVPEGWEEIGDGVFANCSNLTSVHLPQSLKTIGSSCFSNCTNLSEINVPEGLTGIGGLAFSYCSNLHDIVFPDSMVSIGIAAFSHCIGLSGELKIPDLVETINFHVFESCVGYNRLVLGASVNGIAEPAFDFTQFESIVIKATTPPLLHKATTPDAWHFPADIPIIVPCGSLEAYQNSEDWSGFTNITEDCGSGLIEFHGSEWYYEIVDVNGNITYQHLEYTADTTVHNKDVQIIIRTNTLYDKGEHQEVTREYLYEEDEVVYWWNKELQEFTMLYDLGAEEGDEWEIKVGTESLVMHVDAVNHYYYDGQLFRMLQVSDEDDLFSGTIVCGVGHLSSFFPERLMTRDKGYRVQGLRCYWNYGNLLFTLNRDNCDAIYTELHNGLDDPEEMLFALYPNPTHGVLFVETVCTPSLPSQTYRITNMMGQTLMTGQISAETQQIDVSNLPQGMYFISVGEVTQKFVVR